MASLAMLLLYMVNFNGVRCKSLAPYFFYLFFKIFLFYLLTNANKQNIISLVIVQAKGG